jgi:hypothetical protein
MGHDGDPYLCIVMGRNWRHLFIIKAMDDGFVYTLQWDRNEAFIITR